MPHSRTKPTTFYQFIKADARSIPLPPASVDLIVTSPPYWRKRDYGVVEQIGQEGTVEQYIANLLDALQGWRTILAPSGSIFLNIGDSYNNGSLVGIPALMEIAVLKQGWRLANRIIWAKQSGTPDPSYSRLASRYEYIFHLVPKGSYYYDKYGYTKQYSKEDGNPGDVWDLKPVRHNGNHLAPFLPELVARAISLGCPREVCSQCNRPRTRIVGRSEKLNPKRPQARRAMELAKKVGLRSDHIAAIQATGISDAGKALTYQNGTGKNSERVQELAREAKELLGGYFREFTFPQRISKGWTKCECQQPLRAGIVLDPFVGTGTTMKVAEQLGRSAIGVDLVQYAEVEAFLIQH